MIKTFSSRAGRLSLTNKNYLSLQSDCLISPETKPKTNNPIVIDIGFGDAQSFSEDVLINKKYCFIGIEPYKKGFARAVEFYEKEKPKNVKYIIIKTKIFFLKIIKTHFLFLFHLDYEPCFHKILL